MSYQHTLNNIPYHLTQPLTDRYLPDVIDFAFKSLKVSENGLELHGTYFDRSLETRRIKRPEFRTELHATIPADRLKDVVRGLQYTARAGSWRRLMNEMVGEFNGSRLYILHNGDIPQYILVSYQRRMTQGTFMIPIQQLEVYLKTFNDAPSQDCHVHYIDISELQKVASPLPGKRPKKIIEVVGVETFRITRTDIELGLRFIHQTDMYAVTQILGISPNDTLVKACVI